jgi:hypothetical protein
MVGVKRIMATPTDKMSNLFQQQAFPDIKRIKEAWGLNPLLR